MNATSTWPRNRLLLALPARALKQVIPNLEQVQCRREQVLLDADSSLDHVYFPDSGVLSVVAVYPDGSLIEMATIGREGATGFQAVFGARRSSARLLVQVPGTAARMSRGAFKRASDTMPAFRNLMYGAARQDIVVGSAPLPGEFQQTPRRLTMLPNSPPPLNTAPRRARSHQYP